MGSQQVINNHSLAEIKSASSRLHSEATVMTDIFKSDINITIWQRQLTNKLIQATDKIISANPNLKISTIVTPDDVSSVISDELGEGDEISIFREDVVELVDMFCFLFELQSVGLRLTTLEHAMCPRFHVDRVPCRLVTTYQGIATEWLENETVDRSKLGMGNQGKPDELSGVYTKPSQIQQLSHGEVALLKGELWDGNEGRGLVHRSPQVSAGERRLLVTLDFV